MEQEPQRERSGVTTQRIGIDGDFDRKIADFERLMTLVGDAGARRAST